VHHKGECVLDKIDCINDSFIKPCFQSPSEIFSPLFGCHQKFLLGNLGWGRAFGLEGEFEVADDSIHHRIISDKSDDFHHCYFYFANEWLSRKIQRKEKNFDFSIIICMITINYAQQIR